MLEDIYEETTEISVKGRPIRVPAVFVQNITIAITGRFLKTATIKGETWLEKKLLDNPERIITVLRPMNLKIDIFHFNQMLPDVAA